MPLVSVIIPNYNHDKYLKARIESVLNQTFQDFELIILDDCSTDNSQNIIEQYRLHPKLTTIIYNKKNSGSPFKQWIKGISIAKCEWVWIAESDDVAHSQFLETLLHHAQTHPTAAIVYCNSYRERPAEPGSFTTTADETNFDFDTKVWSDNHLIKSEEANPVYLCKKNIILNASSAVIKKKYIAQLPVELKNMNYYGDWYCYIDIAAKADIFYCSKLLNTFRRHPLSLIAKSDKEKVKIDCFRILDLLLKQPNVNRTETIDYFTNAYLGTGVKKEGFLSLIYTTAHYCLIHPYLAARVTAKIIRSKLNKKKS